jgi:predicted transcriptional regulator
MKTDAVIQDDIVKVFMKEKSALKLKNITYLCPYTYHQVTSAISALTAKGFVKRVGSGRYELTENAKIMEMDPKIQIEILQRQVAFLEGELKNLTSRFARASYR